MNRINLTLSLLLSIILQSCDQITTPKNKEIEVTWELVSNLNENGPTLFAQFVLSNNSKFTLNEKNWELYFNQTPRTIIENQESTTNHSRVINLSGDWWVIKPEPGFKLEPGQSIAISYQAPFWFIKETNAPCGLYFVFKTTAGKEKIVEAKNYKTLPFERPEQVARGVNERLPFPSPQNDYEANELQGLSVLPRSHLPKILPSPKLLKSNDEIFEMSSRTTIYANSNGLEFEATYLREQLKQLLGLKVELSGQQNGNTIILNLDQKPGKDPESYSLNISQKAIEITASNKKGVFYGIQSLISLLPIVSILSRGDKIDLGGISVVDAPRFGYRGVHIDVARNFLPKETIKKAIDILAFYKVNKLHLHLTDDEGWRLEIAALPELSQIGGQRGHTNKDAAALHPAYGSGPYPRAPGTGFFSRQDFVEILRYAGERHIEVIPEINLPGHSRAAIKSMEARYKYYMKLGNTKAAIEFRLIDPDDQSVYLSAQFYNDNVANVALESVYRFFETVVDEVIDIYAEAKHPLNIIHVGGDEVPKGAWTMSPMINELMRKRPDIKHYENIHAYFTERALEILTSKGLKMAGWEEIALHNDNGQRVNSIFANGRVIPYVWNNLWGAQDLAYRLANAGYPVVMCHVTNFYFDLAYNNHPSEPGLYWGGFVNTRNAWHYNPYNLFWTTTKDNMGRLIDIDKEYEGMVRLNPTAKKNIKGLQAQLWSETILNPNMLEYYLLPKLIGFAETAWANERRWETTQDPALRQKQVLEDWNVFANTLAIRELPRLSKIFEGFNFRVPPPGAKIEDGVLFANVEFPGLQIRYTTDGSEPNIYSELFVKPIATMQETIRLKAFDIAGKSSRTVTIKPSSDELLF